MGGRLLDWLGAGIAADRPAAIDMPALLVPDSTAFYLATDTSILNVFDPVTVSWFEADIAALAALAFSTLPDVDWSTPPTNGQIFEWSVGTSKLIPVDKPVAGHTDEQIQDLVATLATQGTGITITYDDGAATLTFATTITQYTDELAQDAVAAAIAAGTHVGITVVYDDGANTLSFQSTVTQYTDEMAMDAVAAMIAAGSHIGINIIYDDVGNAIDFEVTVTQYTDTLAQAAVRRTINNQVDSYTLVLADALAYVRLNKATAVNLTVPDNATVAYATGTEIPFFQKGAGQVTVVATAGVTINTPQTLKLAGQNSSGLLIKVAADEWDLTGDLELLP